MQLKDKVFLVTGGSRGIGRGVVLEMAKEGAVVAVNYVQAKDKADEVVAEIRKLGGRALAVQADVRVKRDVDAMVASVVREFGAIDVLVNNAGVVVFKEFFDFTEEDWDYTFDINCKGIFLTSQAVARHMKERGTGGNIVNVASISGEQLTSLLQLAYCASKAANHMLVKGMAVALAPYKIRVNAVLPGGIPTDQNTQFLQVPEIREKFIQATPVKRLGTPQDVAGAIKYFVSDAASWVTGSLLVMDGGYTLGVGV